VCNRSSLSGSGGHRNAAYARGRKLGLSVGGVEGFVRGAVLVHSDGKMEPGFGIRVCGSSIGPPGEGRRDSTVKASAEFHHNCFRVRVA